MSTRSIKIDHPGDGDWIMLRVGGVFNDKTDHTVALHRDGKMAGGVVFTGFLGASILVHMAGSGDNWATPDFLWMVFDYAFNQLGCRKVMGLVDSENTRALEIDIRLGFRIVASIPDVMLGPGELVVLMMDRSECKWLKIKPRYYRSNRVHTPAREDSE